LNSSVQNAKTGLLSHFSPNRQLPYLSILSPIHRIGDGVNLSDSHTHHLRCHHNSVMVTIADKRSLIDLFMFRAFGFVWPWF